MGLTGVGLPWFRMYCEFATDPSVQFLSFDDQRHFVMLLCLKGSELLDKPYEPEILEKVVAGALGLSLPVAADVKHRLFHAKLINERWEPVNWDKRQFVSDSSTPRVQALRKRRCNVTETPSDNRLQITDTEKTKTVSAAEPPTWMVDFKLEYPERSGDQNWRGAVRAANARLAEGHTPEEFIAGAKRYRAFCDAAGKTHTEYVQQASRFLGPGKSFLLPWHAPPKPENATERIQRRMQERNRVIDADEPTSKLLAAAC